MPGDDARDPLVALAQSLAREQVPHCRWVRSTDPEGTHFQYDVDLLVSRPDVPRVSALLSRLGFKQVKPPSTRAVPGALHSLAYDTARDRLIRVHVHHQLLLGDEWTLNFRLPIEGRCLSSAEQDVSFRVPAPELELIVFVLQAMLRHSALDILCGREGLSQAARRLAELEARASRERVDEVLHRDLGFLGPKLYDRCTEALRTTASRWKRLAARQQLLRKMGAHARRPPAMDLCLRLWRRTVWVSSHLLGRPSHYRLEGGGAIIAIVGGDGAGKSTVVAGLRAWLSRDFTTANVHLGKPRWSMTTTAVRGVVKCGQLLGFYPPESSFRETLEQKSLVTAGPWLLREVCRARDRYTRYVSARRSAAGGSLVISDRFPLPQIRLMDGPLALRLLNALDASREGGFLATRAGRLLASALVKREESYYRRFTSPEVLIVLRIDPESAAQRRTGEDLIAVRERATEIWQIDWQQTNAHVIDAGKPKAEVLAEAKALVWSGL